LNRSIPGALKNAIDRASRPWARTPSTHPRGRTRRLHQLPPEIFPGGGEVTNESTREFLQNYMAEFRDHTVRVLTSCPASRNADAVVRGSRTRRRAGRPRRASLSAYSRSTVGAGRIGKRSSSEERT
jgi:hypothetical protein